MTMPNKRLVDVDSFTAQDLIVPGYTTAIGVYYETLAKPRYHVTWSDNIQITPDLAQAAYADFEEWWGSMIGTIVRASVYVIAHNLSEAAFKEWEFEHMAKPLLKELGANWMMAVDGWHVS